MGHLIQLCEGVRPLVSEELTDLDLSCRSIPESGLGELAEPRGSVVVDDLERLGQCPQYRTYLLGFAVRKRREYGEEQILASFGRLMANAC
jgi:hypothetical protein